MKYDQIRYFTNPLKVEKFDEQISGENWVMGFSTGRDTCDNKNYAVTTDHVNASRLDNLCAAEMAFLFSKSTRFYNLTKDLLKARLPREQLEIKMEMQKLITELDNEVERHRRLNCNM